MVTVVVEESHHQTRFAAPDAARRLDIFGHVLGLSVHEHEPEARNIDADAEHIAG